MKAGGLIGKIEKGQQVSVHKAPGISRVKIQKENGLAIVAADIVSLFPLLKDIEASIFARNAILESSIH